MLVKLFINSARIAASGSENGFEPAYVSAQGFDDAPLSAVKKCKELYLSKIFKKSLLSKLCLKNYFIFFLFSED